MALSPEEIAEYSAITSAPAALSPEEIAEYKSVAPAPDNTFAEPVWSPEIANAQAGKAVFDEMDSFDRFFTGVGQAPRQLWEGAMDIAGVGTDEAKQSAQFLEQNTGPAALAGEIVGDIGLLALPAAGVAKAATTPLRGLAAESGLVGLYEGIKQPQTGETRAENAAEGAGYTALFGGALLPLKYLKDTRSAAAIKQLDEQKIPLTPAMTGGERTATLENFMTNFPVIGGRTRLLQQKAVKEWNRQLLSHVAPGGSVSDAGTEGFKQLKKQFDTGYNQVWESIRDRPGSVAKIKNNTNSAFKAFQKNLDSSFDTSTAGKKQVKAYADDLKKRFASDKSDIVGNARKMDKALREKIAVAESPEMRRAYTELREGLRDGVFPDGTDYNRDLFSVDPNSPLGKLRNIDGKWKDYKILEKAGSGTNAFKRGSIILPDDLSNAARVKNSGSVTGEGSFIDEAAEAQETIGRIKDPYVDPSGKTLGNIAATVAAVTNPLPTAVAAGVAPLVLREGVRKGLTSAPLARMAASKAADPITRMLRQAGVTGFDEGY